MTNFLRLAGPILMLGRTALFQPLTWGYVRWPREAHVQWCQNRFLDWAETKERHIRFCCHIFSTGGYSGEVQIFYWFTVRILLHISQWWSTIAQNLWLPANAETRANNCWNLWLWTIIIWSSVTRWRPVKAANSRGVSGACSIYSHQIKSAHAGVWLWWSSDEH